MELRAKHRPRVILIEDKASGTQVIQDLKNDGCFEVKSYSAPPQTDKIMRLHAQTAVFESGKVLLPTVALWLAEYERELTTFPRTKFDDQVGSTTQALDYFSQNRGAEIWAILGRGYRQELRNGTQ